MKLADNEEEKTPDCTLDKPVQRVMEMIFNQQYFDAVMNQLNYDANKMPLGKLSKKTILKGYQALKDLAALLDDAALAQTQYNTTFSAATEQLSNLYFSFIPHAFGRRNVPPVIRTHDLLKREVELLESLSDMKDAAELMKNSGKKETIHPLDSRFSSLGLQEMATLDHKSTEFQNLHDYLIDTKGSSHYLNYEVQDIFRIERQGENDRFDKSAFSKIPSDRRLLWHGSRCTNFGGILSQGLRIAPPEAPVSGYMFGKGIYLADMSSKSANYCAASISNNHALLLLCEAELGAPMQVLYSSSYNAGAEAKAKGVWSTHGVGATAPQKWKDASCVHSSLKGVSMVSNSQSSIWQREQRKQPADICCLARHGNQARKGLCPKCFTFLQRVYLL
jgi:poly [ADP-ribose] polymerase 2/3/4